MLAAIAVGSQMASGAEGVRRAAPCVVAVLSFDALPEGVSVLEMAQTPTIEVPFERLSVLVNSGQEPLYIAVPASYTTNAERDGSGLPSEFLPFYKLVSDTVFAWRQDASVPVGQDAAGVPVYGWQWVPLDPADYFYRSAGSSAGIALIPDAQAFLKTIGGPVDVSDCVAPTPRRFELAALTPDGPAPLRGEVRYTAVSN